MQKDKSINLNGTLKKSDRKLCQNKFKLLTILLFVFLLQQCSCISFCVYKSFFENEIFKSNYQNVFFLISFELESYVSYQKKIKIENKLRKSIYI